MIPMIFPCGTRQFGAERIALLCALESLDVDPFGFIDVIYEKASDYSEAFLLFVRF
jgi:hypothetical protein